MTESQARLPSKPCRGEGGTTCTRVFKLPTHTAAASHGVTGKIHSAIPIAFKSKEDKDKNMGHWGAEHFSDKASQFWIGSDSFWSILTPLKTGRNFVEKNNFCLHHLRKIKTMALFYRQRW